MSLHAVAKATLEFRGVAVPVKLYLAAKDEGISFRRICPSCRTTALSHKQWCVRCAAEPYAGLETLHGLVEGERMLLFAARELALLGEPSDHVLHVIELTPAAEMPYERFDGFHYYLGIDSSAPRAAYRLMLAAIAATKLAGLVRLVLYGRERFAVLYVRGQVLLLSTLFYAGEIRDIVDVPLPEPRELDRKQLLLGKQLLEQMTVPALDLTVTVDRKKERVDEYVEARKKGDVPAPGLKPAAPPTSVVDLTESLEAALGKTNAQRSSVKTKRDGRVDRRPRSKRRLAS